MISIEQGDVLEWVKKYEGEPFHALLCDPPYHLTSIVKRFGKANSAPAKDKDGVYQRASRGFMGQEWDGGDVAFRPETWHLLGQVLYPGAFGMAYAGSRGYHRLATAIEDAGFIIHPAIAWLNVQGFPKATNIAKQLGREVTESGEWAGHRYGLQALKPMVEFICVFQRPYEGRPIDNITETGAGAINIDAGRLGINSAVDDPRLGGKGDWATDKAAQNIYNGGYAGDRIGSSSLGRWPGNFVASHTPECKVVGKATIDGYVINRFEDGMKPFGEGAGHEYDGEEVAGQKVDIYECSQDCPVRQLNEQAGLLTSGMMQAGTQRHQDGGYNGHFPNEATTHPTYGDSGGIARFFYQADWAAETIEKIEAGLPARYEPKVTVGEREAGLNKLPANKKDRMDSTFQDDRPHTREGYEYEPTERHNNHPTLKPIGLSRWLSRLLLPPGAYAPRRLLVPFSGAASEAIGAWQAGWDDITGVEMIAEYVEIGLARVEYWTKKRGYQLGFSI